MLPFWIQQKKRRDSNFELQETSGRKASQHKMMLASTTVLLMATEVNCQPLLRAVLYSLLIQQDLEWPCMHV